MKIAGYSAKILFLFLFLFNAGCVSETKPGDEDTNQSSIYYSYAPVKINILPLTEFTGPGGGAENTNIKVYIDLLDSYGSQIKAPGVFRFEFYERVMRSADPKGKRIFMWPDIDLTEPVENNKYWRDFLRSYEFNLGFKGEENRSYIIQVTFLRPGGKRLSCESELKYKK